MNLPVMNLKSLGRNVLGFLAGSLIYFILVLLPFAGPLLSGIAAGRIAKKGPGAGFFLGAFSGIAGACLWAYLLFIVLDLRLDSFFSWLFLFIFVLWNAASIIFAGIGGVLGSIAAGTERLFSGPSPGAVYESGESVMTLVVCPDCGTANPEENIMCSSCGAKID